MQEIYNIFTMCLVWLRPNFIKSVSYNLSVFSKLNMLEEYSNLELKTEKSFDHLLHKETIQKILVELDNCDISNIEELGTPE